MYCNRCGHPIAKESVYCSHCGFHIKHSSSVYNHQQHTIQTSINKEIVILSIPFSKKEIGFYLAWLLLNLILLLTNLNDDWFENEKLWPFNTKSEFKDYGLSEFLLFTLVPLITLFIVKLLNSSKEIKRDSPKVKYDLSYNTDTTPTIIGIGILILTIFLNLAFSGDEVNYVNQSNEMYTVLSVSSFILRIAVTIWVVNIAKSLNRDHSLWGLFAFFLPPLCLIIIGQKRRLSEY
jgi:hypothetical protein